MERSATESDTSQSTLTARLQAKLTVISQIDSLLAALKHTKHTLRLEIDKSETENSSAISRLEKEIRTEIKGLELIESRLRDRNRTSDTVEAAVHNLQSLESSKDGKVLLWVVKNDAGNALKRRVGKVKEEWMKSAGRKRGFRTKHVPIGTVPSQNTSQPPPSLPSLSVARLSSLP